MVSFAHLADCHIGAYRDPRLSILVDKAFTKAIARILSAKVDFVLIAGDLFNTALPGIEHVSHVTRQMSLLRDAGIPVYVIAGSHDYSPTGKTMLSVLESAGLCVNVFTGEVRDEQLFLEFTVDEKTGVKIVGVLGKAAQLDSELYKTLVKEHLELEGGKKIFLFHTTLEELRPKDMRSESQPVSFLPKSFDYYAGGHVHIIAGKDFPGYKNVVYPGPLFPASFSELEELGSGGFFLVDDSSGSFVKERIDISVKKTRNIVLDCTEKTPSLLEQELSSALSTDIQDTIVLVRMQGKLANGAVSDIDFHTLFSNAQKRGAYACLKNTFAVSSHEFVERDVTVASSDAVEQEVIAEHVGQVPLAGFSSEKEKMLFHSLISSLAISQHEGESKHEYESRILDEARKLFH